MARDASWDFAASPGLRPTTDRVRETLFNWLTAGDGTGRAVLDLYAGSGALGLEALSRGAAHCHFVESNSAASRKISEHYPCASSCWQSGSRSVAAYAGISSAGRDEDGLPEPHELRAHQQGGEQVHSSDQAADGDQDRRHEKAPADETLSAVCRPGWKHGETTPQQRASTASARACMLKNV